MFMFQHDGVVHTDFTFPCLELLFVQTSNANRMQYLKGAEVKVIPMLVCLAIYTVARYIA